MSIRSYSTHRRSKSNYVANQIPNNFRVMLKSRSGKFNELQPALSPTSIRHNLTQHSIKSQLNHTQNSFYKPDIKGFVKSMQSKQDVSESNKKNVGGIHCDRPESKEQNMEEQKEYREEAKEDEREERRQKRGLLSQNGSQLNIQKMSQMSLQQIDSKIDELLKMKLLKTKQSRTHRTYEIDQIQRQINFVIQYLQNYSFFHEQNGIDDNLQFTNQRIAILEKIMAEGAIQSEVELCVFRLLRNTFLPKRLKGNQKF